MLGNELFHRHLLGEGFFIALLFFQVSSTVIKNKLTHQNSSDNFTTCLGSTSNIEILGNPRNQVFQI